MHPGSWVSAEVPGRTLLSLRSRGGSGALCWGETSVPHICWGPSASQVARVCSRTSGPDSARPLPFSSASPSFHDSAGTPWISQIKSFQKRLLCAMAGLPTGAGTICSPGAGVSWEEPGARTPRATWPEPVPAAWPAQSPTGLGHPKPSRGRGHHGEALLGTESRWH